MWLESRFSWASFQMLLAEKSVACHGQAVEILDSTVRTSIRICSVKS